MKSKQPICAECQKFMVWADATDLLMGTGGPGGGQAFGGYQEGIDVLELGGWYHIFVTRCIGLIVDWPYAVTP